MLKLFSTTYLIQLIIFPAGETLSSNGMSFQRDIAACIRTAYEECKFDSCPSINENILALDIQESETGNSRSFLFSSESNIKSFRGFKEYVTGGHCIDVKSGEVLVFARIDETHHTIIINLQVVNSEP